VFGEDDRSYRAMEREVLEENVIELKQNGENLLNTLGTIFVEIVKNY
jgi:hypothetical protein